MVMKPTHKYDDIIALPRHVSPTRPPMSAHDRAAQFSPFAALTGYEEAIEETARLTQTKGELDENEKELLNQKLLLIGDMAPELPAVSLTYFRPDGKKSGGAYLELAARVRKLDRDNRRLVLSGGISIDFDDIFRIEIPEADHE